MGALRHMGADQRHRNMHCDMQEVREYVYGRQRPHWFLVSKYEPRPISAISRSMLCFWAATIDRNELVKAVTHLLQGRMPQIPDQPMCIECKLKENVCVYTQGKVCLGPITLAGCDAICPTYGDGCEGCRGTISNPNFQSLREVMLEHGVSEEEIESRLTMFMTNQILAMAKAQ
jgi:hypothetical protein